MAALPLDDGAGSVGIEGVLDQYGDVLGADRVQGGCVDDAGSEVAELHGLGVAELVDGVGGLDDLWVGCHEAVHVGPYLQDLSPELGRQDAGGVVGTSAAQVDDVTSVAVAGYEAGDHCDAAEACEGVAYQFPGEFGVGYLLVARLVGVDELQGVVKHGTLDQGADYPGRQSFSVTFNFEEGLVGKALQDEGAEIEVLESGKQGIQLFLERVAGCSARNHLIHQGEMALAHLLPGLLVLGVALGCHARGGNQLVGDAAES